MITMKLKEIGKITTGKTPSKNIKNAFGNYISFLTPKDFNGQRYSNITERSLSIEGVENVYNYIVKGPSVSVTCIGSDMGKTIFNEKDIISNQQINSISEIDSNINPMYLYYLLYTKRKQLHFIGSAQGSTMPILNKSDFGNLEFSFPSRKEQDIIVAKINSFDSKIEINNKINTNLFELVNVIFQQSFNCNGNIPLSHYFLPKRGKNLLKKNVEPGVVPVVAGGLKPAAYHNISNTETPVITISASGANAGYVQIWGQKVWSSDSSYIDSSITDNIYFWYIFLKSRQKQIFDAQTGSAQPHIYPKHIGNLLISKLDEEQVQSFNKKVTPIFEKIFQNQRNNSVMEDVKNSLLYKFFNDY